MKLSLVTSALNIALRYQNKLQWCIDDERQFKRAKRSQTPADATVLKTFFFHYKFVIFRRRSKKIAILESLKVFYVCYMQIFNSRDDHVTTFRHPSGAYICQMRGQRITRLPKGTPP